MTSAGEQASRELFFAFLRGWNRRDAHAIAALFAADGGLVGFDGSEVGGGPPGVEAHLAPIFRDHATAAYVGIVRGVQALGPDALIVRAVVGMVPPGGEDVRSDVNAIQTLVAVREGDAWRIASLQATPAAFHGRPEAVATLTSELREALRAGGIDS